MKAKNISVSPFDDFRRHMESRPSRKLSAGLKIALALLLVGGAAASNAQDEQRSAIQVSPTLRRHVLLPSSSLPDPSLQRVKVQPKLAPQNLQSVNNTGSGLVYTCDPNVAAATCTYLNTTIAGYYNSIFTNANANIYVQYGTTGLGESEGYYNLVSYSDYVTALTNITPKSSNAASALSAINTYASTPYGGGNVEVTVALGTALGFSGLYGITPTEAACTPGTAGCYNEIVTVANAATQADEGFTLYYDNLGGSETSDQYDFYSVVEHETDEVLGTSSCISTGGASLDDGCDFDGGTGVPSAVDLERFSSPGTLALDSSPSTTAGQYFSYDGGADYGAVGRDATPTAKMYNTLNNGEDFADYTSSSPDCGTNEAIQDATGCPGEDSGMTVFNDGQSEITILNVVGFSIPEAVITSPAPGGDLGGSSVTFNWTAAAGATEYWMYVGTTLGASNIFDSNGGITATSEQVTGLPTSGTVYVRLFSYLAGEFWTSTDFTFTGSGGGTPTVSLSATSLTFPSENVGAISPSQSVTLTNTGTSTLTISSIGVTGTNASSFDFATSCGTSVAAGANCTIHGHFAPTTGGPLTAAVTIVDNASGSPQSIGLSGTGVNAPVVSLSATSLTFPSENVGVNSPSQSVTLTNTGTAALSITSIAVTGTNASSFDFATSCGSSLAAGANCTIHGHFTPTAGGSLKAAVTITDNASGSPQSIALSGTGINAPVVSLSATSLTFPSENVGVNSPSQSVTLTNTGTAALSITSIAVTGTNASSFDFATSCGSSLAAGANCTIHGHFTPTAGGSLKAAVTITDNASGSPQSIALSGTGVSTSGPSVSLSSTSLTFGAQAVETTSASQSVTMTNVGNQSLTITSIAVTGANASSFVFANSCGASLAAGANCTIHGHFTPTTTGPLSAAITITDNASGSPQSISLSGTGN